MIAIRNPLLLGLTPSEPTTIFAVIGKLMKANTVKSLLLAAGFCVSASSHAADGAQDGSSLLGMCGGADKVPALSVMCLSYTTGFIEAANHYAVAAGKPPLFCLHEGDKARIPMLVSYWMKAHPGQMKMPAGQVLHQVFSMSFGCRK